MDSFKKTKQNKTKHFLSPKSPRFEQNVNVWPLFLDGVINQLKKELLIAAFYLCFSFDGNIRIITAGGQ